jgi:hypothetical protein
LLTCPIWRLRLPFDLSVKTNLQRGVWPAFTSTFGNECDFGWDGVKASFFPNFSHKSSLQRFIEMRRTARKVDTFEAAVEFANDQQLVSGTEDRCANLDRILIQKVSSQDWRLVKEPSAVVRRSKAALHRLLDSLIRRTNLRSSELRAQAMELADLSAAMADGSLPR